ncbi:MAG: arginine--tRNA ligase [Bacillus thermozeamaize]|mgnify:CR=1 FL=1|uniref:Arginine--tRNA ligase n=1 Tax=Bacillus thermozeamaize TaxID=230954 RepID=A0A1Y3PUP7_9BACI|nr:MAG: arginine--tRNA ligase [Bacillus thermozeamaize]
MLFEWAARLLQPHVQMSEEEVLRLLARPPKPEMGDVAFPCFSLAKVWRRSPQQIAVELRDRLLAAGGTDDTNREHGRFGQPLKQVEAVGGYLNLFFDRAALWPRMLAQALNAPLPQPGEGKTVVVEFSSPNIAKPFGVGHLRSTVIGHALARIYEALGYRVVRINHLGDWGTQFGKEIAAYKRWGDPERIKANPIPELLALYVRFHEEAEQNPELEEEGRAWFKKLEEGDREARELWQWFVDESLKAFRQTYRLLGVEFDHYTGESFYTDQIPRVVDALREKGLLQESEGAWVVDLSEREMPPCLILKADGTTIYATRDLAAAIYRYEQFGFEKMLYVVGAEQTLHFRQVFAVLEKMGHAWASRCEHVPFGLMQIEGKKMSTRKGRVIFLEEVLQEAVERAEAIIQEKNPSLPDRQVVARQIGVGAVIFHDLKTHRIHNVNFSWDEVLNFDGETGPYVQYTYARTQSVLRKARALREGADAREATTAGGDGVNAAGDAAIAGDQAGAWEAPPWLEHSKAWEVCLHLLQFGKAVERAAAGNEPSQVARYLLDLCQLYNRFYHDERILVEDAQEREAKLRLTEAVGQVLKRGLYLLGLEAPPQI